LYTGAGNGDELLMRVHLRWEDMLSSLVSSPNWCNGGLGWL
jgi:hypothetical protein